MAKQNEYQGSCFCGEVQFTVSGTPAGMGFCHCESCRQWSAGPVNAFTLWHPESVKITRGGERIARFNKTPRSTRQWCSKCGGHLFTEHPEMGLVDVYAATIPAFPFEAGVHVHYQETVLPMQDGITKMQDLPTEAGGTGIEISE